MAATELFNVLEGIIFLDEGHSEKLKNGFIVRANKSRFFVKVTFPGCKFQ